ncbi:MAG: hypothetical protein U0992_03070 [Planctomycetaceae bacterium]
MPTTITRIIARDIRFPTSQNLDGSDAMNPDPDYSAAYCVLETDRADGLAGHGMTFTIGRGNDLCVAGIHALAPLIVGRTLESCMADPAGFWRSLAGDSQLRWVGPEKGVIHLATAAIVNAVWDLWAKVAGKPLWRLVAEMSPEQLAACIDYRHISDALRPDEAVAILKKLEPTKAERIAELERTGYPAYTTSAGGWATTTTSCVRSAGDAWPTGGRCSRSRSGAICRTTFAGAGSFARRLGLIAG